MNILINDVKPGQTIRFEFGDYGNMATSKVHSICEIKDEGIQLELSMPYGTERVWFELNDSVELVEV